MKKPNDLLTVASAASEKGVHIKSVYRAIAQKRLVAEPQGETLLIRRRELDRWRARRGAPKKVATEPPGGPQGASGTAPD